MKITTGLIILLLVNSSSQITSVRAIEKPTNLITEENDNIAIGKPTIISTIKIESLETNLYSKVIKDESEILNISLIPSVAETTVQVPIELNKGEFVVLYKNELGRTFNSGNIYNKNNHSLGIIHAELVNNDGKAQLISTVINDNTLELKVKTKNLSQMVHIQVKINATTFSTYFNNSEWINRNGITSLSLTQKNDITSSINSDLNKVIKIDAWDKIKSIHNSNINWYNSDGMQDQFDCHFDFAKKKALWNLEPNRPDVDYFSTVLASCNP